MLAIRPILSSGQKGQDIANLHLALDKLGFGGPVPPQERTDKVFGDGTTALSKGTRKTKRSGTFLGEIHLFSHSGKGRSSVTAR